MKAVLFKSIERIHRSNLIGMGVLPIQFIDGEGWRELNLDGTEKYHIYDLEDGLKISKKINIEAIKENGQSIQFQGILRIDTEVEIEYIRYGGILQYVLANLLKQ